MCIYIYKYTRTLWIIIKRKHITSNPVTPVTEEEFLLNNNFVVWDRPYSQEAHTILHETGAHLEPS